MPMLLLPLRGLARSQGLTYWSNTFGDHIWRFGLAAWHTAYHNESIHEHIKYSC